MTNHKARIFKPVREFGKLPNFIVYIQNCTQSSLFWVIFLTVDSTAKSNLDLVHLLHYHVQLGSIIYCYIKITKFPED